MKFGVTDLSRIRCSWGHRVFIASVVLGAALTSDSTSFAQQRKQVVRTSHTKERTKEFIDDYTNSIGLDGGFDRPRTLDRRQPTGQNQIDAKAIRGLIHEFANSLTQLTYDLNDQMNQVSGLRQVYSDALRLSGTAAGIHKRAEKAGVDAAMLDDLQQLDADWHELAYRLSNVRDLSSDSRSLVADINDSEKRIRQLIGMQQQLDRRQLNLKSAGLAADLENLQEDIASELGNSRDSQSYRRSISRARQSVLSLITILRDEYSDTPTIVDAYKQFETLWLPLAQKLRSEDDRYIERGVRRVSASVTEIHQLLLLPHQTDQSQFVFLAKSLKKDIDEFFDRTPLVLVMHLPNSKQALAVADQFYGTCARFVEVVNQSQDQAEILDSFRKIEIAERAFNDVYRDIDSDRAAAVLSRIVQTTNALRSSLQIQRDDFDARAAAEVAASVQNFTEQIASVSRRWLEHDNQAFASECMDELNSLVDTAAQLHDDLLDGKRPPELNQGIADIYDRWRRAYGFLVKCQTEERSSLGRLSNALTPAIVELRTMVIQ